MQGHHIVRNDNLCRAQCLLQRRIKRLRERVKFIRHVAAIQFALYGLDARVTRIHFGNQQCVVAAPCNQLHRGAVRAQ